MALARWMELNSVNFLRGLHPLVLLTCVPLVGYCCRWTLLAWIFLLWISVTCILLVTFRFDLVFSNGYLYDYSMAWASIAVVPSRWMTHSQKVSLGTFQMLLLISIKVVRLLVKLTLVALLLLAEAVDTPLLLSTLYFFIEFCKDF